MVERESWGSWTQFLFSLIGSMVGLGNIWRFPYICHRSGGGAFLVPFAAFMVVLAIPIGLLELLYYQFAGVGPGKVWVVCPLFKGIWFSMMTMVFVSSSYYTMLMAYMLYYLAVSFSPTLPWTTCDNDWNTPDCITHEEIVNSTTGIMNVTTNLTARVSSAEEYWLRGVLSQTPSIADLGEFRWQLVLCLVVSHVICVLCVARGVQVMGKVSYIAATLPYVLLIILLVRGLMLPGSGDGIYYFFYPRWDRLVDHTVWRDAATQLIYSTGVGWGIIGTLASYNKFHNNCYRDALLMPILDTATSLFAGVIIFAYIGYMAHLSGQKVDSVVQEGPGLVFVAYPTALDTLPMPQVWAVVFFFMLFCTGLDSQFVNIQTLASAVVDYKVNLLPHKTKVVFGLTFISFLIGLPMTTEGGLYVLSLLDWYVASISILLVVIMEHVVFGWIYGVDRLFNDIEQMIGYRVPTFFGLAWKYVVPISLSVLWVSGLVDFKPIMEVYPGYYPWSDALGLLIAFIPILPMPILAGMELYKHEGSFKQRLVAAAKPLPRWRPSKNTDTVELESITFDLVKEAKNDTAI